MERSSQISARNQHIKKDKINQQNYKYVKKQQKKETQEENEQTQIKLEKDTKSQNQNEKEQNDLISDNQLNLNSNNQKEGNNKMSRLILWLRNDLRMHDNYVFNWAMNYKSANKEVVPLFCFDPRYYFKDQSQTKYASRKTGLIRARFQIETVENLRKNLRNIGSDLLISCEKPEDFIPKLIQENQDAENIIVYQSEITSEELIIENKVRKNIEILQKKNKEQISAKMKSVQGLTLYHLNDLEYDPNEFLPPNYTKFRESNYNVQVRPLRPTPSKNQFCLPKNQSEFIEQSRNFIPKLIDFGYEQEEIQQDRDKRSCFKFIGGEDKGLDRLNEYITGKRSIDHYAETRNNLIGSEYSSKLSPWLANGSLSIRKVYFATKEFEEINQPNQSTKKFIDELFWRDFCKYWFIRHKNKGFSQYGIQDKSQLVWKTDKNIIERWQKGQTGMPLVDSLMREMNASGFMGNRGRQIVASYLTLDLKQDWRYGAHYFEEMLVDHDVTSNYGSWNFSAGIGPGKVLNFNSLKQSRDFDKDGKFIRMWCPELKNVPNNYIHDPWNMPLEIQKSTGVLIGQNYPKPIACHKYTSQENANNQFRNNNQMNSNGHKSNGQTEGKFNQSNYQYKQKSFNQIDFQEELKFSSKENSENFQNSKQKKKFEKDKNQKE